MKSGKSSAIALVLGLLVASPAAALQVPPVTPIEEPAHLEVAVGDTGDAPRGIAESLDGLSAPIRTVLLLSLMTLLPGMLLTLTSYTRIIIVLSFVRRAIGAPELPPSPVLIGLALFLTGAVMSPTFSRVHSTAVEPYLAGDIELSGAATAATGELRQFMLRHIRDEDLAVALQLAEAEPPATLDETPFLVTVPAFVLSELRTAFRMGFIVFLPFVLIDLVVASVLLALGMFMLPPTMIAMPLKILLFILVDGWTLIIQSLAASFGAA